MYGKLFDSIYDGTLYGHWEAIVTLQQLVVLADADGIIDMTPQAICARTSIPMNILEIGLRKLAEPDPYSRTPGEEGRRIVCIDEHRPWGWQLVNYLKYKHLKDSDEVREQNRVRAQKFRDKRNAASRDVTPDNAKSRHTDTDTDTDTKTYKGARKNRSHALPTGFELFWTTYPKRAGSNPKGKAASAYRVRVSEGHKPEEILDGAGKYARFCQQTGKVGTEYVLQAKTFLGPDKHFAQPWDSPSAGVAAPDYSRLIASLPD